MAAAVLEDERVRARRDVRRVDPRRRSGSRRLAARAAELEKPIVMMKVGTSALAAEIALTHTGALVGDDRLVDAALRQCGIVRVRLAGGARRSRPALLARTGPLPPGGLGVVSISGGACDVIADRAELAGVPLGRSPRRRRRDCANVLAGYGTLRNPLDITGAASENPQIFADALAALADDPSVAVARGGAHPAGRRSARRGSGRGSR